jgi:hypothetical protein
MNDEEILKFCEEDPAAADTMIRAFQRSAEFFRSRAAMLRSLMNPSSQSRRPQSRRVKLRLVHSRDSDPV